jgi:hypothetical protein
VVNRARISYEHDEALGGIPEHEFVEICEEAAVVLREGSVASAWNGSAVLDLERQVERRPDPKIPAGTTLSWTLEDDCSGGQAIGGLKTKSEAEVDRVFGTGGAGSIDLGLELSGKGLKAWSKVEAHGLRSMIARPLRDHEGLVVQRGDEDSKGQLPITSLERVFWTVPADG